MVSKKEKFKISILVSFFLTFTYFIFGTLELYMSNTEEIWFKYSDILPTIILLSILIICIFEIIFILLSDRLFKYGIAFVFGVSLALYIQGNFLPNNYGVLDGGMIKWENYQIRLIYNSIIWGIVIISAILFAYKNFKAFLSFSKILTVIILSTQIVTLTIVGYLCYRNINKSDKNNFLSIEGEFEISKKNNTLVFLLDCFDSELFCELLQKYPLEIKRNFEDFTFYHNTVGGATRTKYAIPFIFTGKTNVENDSYAEYLKKSFSESPLFNELKSGSYDARLYTESAYVDMEQKESINNIVEESLYPSSAWGLTKDFLKLTAFRYTPHFLKRYFWMYSGDFDKWKESRGNIDTYVIDDVELYSRLKKENLQCVGDEDVFRFYHLNGAHEPYEMNENCEKIDYVQGDEESQALGSLKIVSEFIEQLKKLEVYENAEIFVMADHGGRDYEQNPLFMIKQRGMRHELQQSEIPLSYIDIPNMFADSLSNKELNIEKAYGHSGERYFYVGNEENNKISIIEYSIRGTAYDKNQISLTGKVFQGNTSQEDYKYQIGTELSFTKDATANKYCMSGFSKNEATHTWTDGNSSKMRFELKGEYNNLLLKINYGVYSPPQNVEVYVNENEVSNFTALEGEEKSIFIPKDYINDDVLELRFEFPNAISPSDLGRSGDPRMLALCMYSLCICSTNE